MYECNLIYFPISMTFYFIKSVPEISGKGVQCIEANFVLSVVKIQFKNNYITFYNLSRFIMIY